MKLINLKKKMLIQYNNFEDLFKEYDFSVPKIAEIINDTLYYFKEKFYYEFINSISNKNIINPREFIFTPIRDKVDPSKNENYEVFKCKMDNFISAIPENDKEEFNKFLKFIENGRKNMSFDRNYDNLPLLIKTYLNQKIDTEKFIYDDIKINLTQLEYISKLTKNNKDLFTNGPETFSFNIPFHGSDRNEKCIFISFAFKSELEFPKSIYIKGSPLFNM